MILEDETIQERDLQCFALPVVDRWLIYSPDQEITALLSESGVSKLRDGDVEPGSDLDLFRSVLRDCSEAPGKREGKKSGAFDPEFLALITTRGCNISCRYCDFGGPTSELRHMDPKIAVGAINWMADHLSQKGRELFFLHFFGGEPMASGDLVDIAVHRTRAVSAEKGLRSYIDISTNGVVSEKRASWMGQHFDSVVLSHDGPPEFQNRNRPGASGKPTFDAVDRTAKILGEGPTELCLRVCITQDSVHQMPRILEWMVQRYQPAIVNFEPLTENDLTSCADLKGAAPIDFARNWLEAHRLARQLNVRLVYSATEDLSRLRHSSCPVGSDAIMVTPDGGINGCYLQPTDWLQHGMDMTLGKFRFGEGACRAEVEKSSVNRLRDLISEKPRCEDCFCQWSCSGGCHVSNTYQGCDENYVDFCVQTRIITAVLLLEGLGEFELIDRLVGDDEALLKLARHPSDYLFLAK